MSDFSNIQRSIKRIQRLQGLEPFLHMGRFEIEETSISFDNPGDAEKFTSEISEAIKSVTQRWVEKELKNLREVVAAVTEVV